MPQPRRLPMTERTRRRASFCPASMRNARWIGVWRAKIQGGRDLCFKTPSHRRDLSASRATMEAGCRILCSPRALVGSTEVGSKCILLGALGARCGAWRSDPGACGVVGVPLPQRPAKLFTRRIHGYTGSEPIQRGERWCNRRRGRGSGSRVMLARMMGMTMIDSARWRFELRSCFPRLWTQPRTGPAVA